jgi:hypothetical protein
MKYTLEKLVLLFEEIVGSAIIAWQYLYVEYLLSIVSWG